MIYSVEDIYKFSGQFDRTITIFFKPNTNAYITFGEYLIGTIHYTRSEREHLQRKVETHNYERTDGIIKLSIAYFPLLNEKQKNMLIYEGFSASEITKILQFYESNENNYTKTNIRSLPEPINIKIDLSDTDEEDLFLWRVDLMINSGYKLMPNEMYRHNGILLRKFENQLSSESLEYFKNPKTGIIKSEIRYEYLKSKQLHGLLNETERKELEITNSRIGKERAAILIKELKKSSEKWKKLNINYKQELTNLINISANFEPQRLNSGKFAIWWDFERFLHIYTRHVKETQLGERFVGKSIFQYNFDDIKRLIQDLLEEIDEEISHHFQYSPSKEFKRVGEMSVYFQGDYYAIQIGVDGKLMRFHKNNLK